MRFWVELSLNSVTIHGIDRDIQDDLTAFGFFTSFKD